MQAFALEWLNLLVRVAHVIAAIMWIGDSFLFMWLDSHLSTPTREREGDVAGELWMTHSGGFYEVVKRRSLRPEELPASLFWFKWESYTTWITGFFLITVVFYLGGSAALVDPGGPIGHGAAVALSLGLLVAGLVVYHLLCLTPLIESARAMGVVGLVALAALAWGLAHVFAPRAVFLQIGAMLGTIMSSNVLLRIIPAQQHMLAATRAGEPVDTSYGLRAKQRSVHNHYLTLPVLFAMVSNHFPSLYAHAQAWLVLALVFVFAVGIKRVMITRAGTHPVVGVGTVGALLGVIVLTAPGPVAIDPALAAGPKVGFATVERIVAARCRTCHSARPADPSFLAAPQGVQPDTPDEIVAHKDRILVRAVLTKTMPLANLTGITDEERQLLGAWIAQGADPKAEAAAAGKAREAFANRCALCHGPEGRGNGPGAAALRPPPRDFGDSAWQAATTDEAIKAIVLEGGAKHDKSPAMPPHPDLGDDPEVLNELVRFLRGLKR